MVKFTSRPLYTGGPNHHIIMCSAVTIGTVVTGLHKMYLFECEQNSHRRWKKNLYVRQISGRQGSNVTLPLSIAYWSQSL